MKVHAGRWLVLMGSGVGRLPLPAGIHSAASG